MHQFESSVTHCQKLTGPPYSFSSISLSILKTQHHSPPPLSLINQPDQPVRQFLLSSFITQRFSFHHSVRLIYQSQNRSYHHSFKTNIATITPISFNVATINIGLKHKNTQQLDKLKTILYLKKVSHASQPIPLTEISFPEVHSNPRSLLLFPFQIIQNNVRNMHGAQHG